MIRNYSRSSDKGLLVPPARPVEECNRVWDSATFLADINHQVNTRANSTKSLGDCIYSMIKTRHKRLSMK
jgi:hypothetical protein